MLNNKPSMVNQRALEYKGNMYYKTAREEILNDIKIASEMPVPHSLGK